MSELRARASDGGFKGATDLAGMAASYNDPNFPDFRVDILTQMGQLASPSIGEESAHPAADRRVMNNSTGKVEVRVSWANGSRETRLVSLLAETPRTIQTVQVNGGSGPIGSGGSETYTVTALDSDGDPIEDVFFVWWVEPNTATGTLAVDRDTRSARLVNEARRADGTMFTSVGTCRIAVLATYNELEVIGYSPVITFVP